jgi:uncharacterized Zn-finger protein
MNSTQTAQPYSVTSGTNVASPTGVSSEATTHVAVYSGGQFECQYCQKRYSSLQSLRTHEKWHTGDLKHKCNYCIKRFRNPSEMKRHEMTHTGRDKGSCSMRYSSLQGSGSTDPFLKKTLNFAKYIPVPPGTCIRSFVRYLPVPS